jgi:hypothetical protein
MVPVRSRRLQTISALSQHCLKLIKFIIGIVVTLISILVCLTRLSKNGGQTVHSFNDPVANAFTPPKFAISRACFLQIFIQPNMSLSDICDSI